MTASIRRPLRIAVLGDLDSIHTQRWLRALAGRGHEMHAISYYRPATELTGVTTHVLSEAAPTLPKEKASPPFSVRSLLPASLLRPVHLIRYQRAGLSAAVEKIAPDVLHAHYLVEYGFYATAARFRPLVVSAWGSDVYKSHDAASNAVVRLTLQRASLVTASDPAMLEAVRKLAPRRTRLELARIGALEDLFFDEQPVSVNLAPGETPPTVISTRAHEPLYGIDTVLRAFARVRNHVPAALLKIAHDGSRRRDLERLAKELSLGSSVQFIGRLSPQEMRDALSGAHVYVSVPFSDSMSASTMEAMARGCFPVVSDLPSQDGFIEHGVSGLRVTTGDFETLATDLQRALVDPELRRKAALINRAKVETEGRLSIQVDRLEAAFYELVERRQNR